MTWAGSAVPATSGVAPMADVWHDLVFTYDGKGGATGTGGGTEDVYVDGQLQLSGPSNGMGSATVDQLATAVGFPINLGAQNDGNGNPAILGSLDLASVRISNGALTAADVQQNFTAGVPGQSTPLNAPANAPTLNAPVATGNGVALNWTYVGDAGTGFSYSVFRSDPSHTTPTAVATGIHGLSYTDSTVTGGVTYTYFVEAVNSKGAGPASNSQQVTALAQGAVTLTSTSFNNGTTAAGTTNQAQRSEVRKIVLAFSSPVQLGAGAVTLISYAGNDTTGAQSDASAALGTPTTSDGGLTWSIPVLPNTAFSDATGSLKDGIYKVTVNPADVTGGTLGGTNLSTTFHRLYGDIDGNKTVNSADYFKFKAAFGSTTGQPNFNSDFDFDGNGKINSADYFKFKANFGRKFTY
jgi:hypothetical protein